VTRITPQSGKALAPFKPATLKADEDELMAELSRPAGSAWFHADLLPVLGCKPSVLIDITSYDVYYVNN
jgi:hypothetical protein